MAVKNKLKETFRWLWITFAYGLIFLMFFGKRIHDHYWPPHRTTIADFVHLSMRASAFGSDSGVLQIQNESEYQITGTLAVVNHDNQQEKTFDVNLDPKQLWEIGWTYGWDFKPHEEIYLQSNVNSVGPASWITTRMDNGGVGIQPKP